ncbi:MAG: hypothetical protein JWS10_3059 [Cypionkella sp.]|uniref:hypothetical protein n=1 Tax=Cypionkella sp. TaxID=2811411 RepID=UPI00262DA820|nr:hypothetical protein [Cypionkella sp.]MDB5660444.1 hypothetical protein [Cypionkella sp.]
MAATLDRDTIAVLIEDVSSLVGLALDLVSELNFVNADGSRIRGMDQLDSLSG